jgi:hypothetical protein
VAYVCRKPGDVLQNLYCALGYIAWEIVRAGGIKAPNISTAFPISEQLPSTAKEKKRYEQ